MISKMMMMIMMMWCVREKKKASERVESESVSGRRCSKMEGGQ